MDPFESLPTEIYDTLLQYFNKQEIVDVLSVLSKSWYGIVGSSSVCMKKVKLNLRSKRKNDFPERVEVLNWMSRKESRTYQHVQINCMLDEAISREVFKFFESKTGASVETINVRSMKFEPEEEIRKIALPKLQELQLMFIPRLAMNSFLTASANLKRLILRNEFPLCYEGVDYTPSDVTIFSVKVCARRNTQLQELELQGRPHFLSFFTDDLTQSFSFNLKKLTVKIETSPEKVVPEHEENFIKFLTQQAKTLEYVYVDSCSANIIKHVFNKMPLLTFIRFDTELREPNKFAIKDLNLEPNEKLTQLEIPYIPLFEDVIEFLDLAPNVEEILIGRIDELLLEYASKALPELKTIFYRFDDIAGGCDKKYEEMKLENPEINQKLILTMNNDFL